MYTDWGIYSIAITASNNISSLSQSLLVQVSEWNFDENFLELTSLDASEISMTTAGLLLTSLSRCQHQDVSQTLLFYWNLHI